MEALPGENTDKYFKSVDDEIQSLTIRDTWEIFQGSQFLITICFQKHGISSARGNLIGKSGNPRHDIVWEGISRRYCLLNP